MHTGPCNLLTTYVRNGCFEEIFAYFNENDVTSSGILFCKFYVYIQILRATEQLIKTRETLYYGDID